MFAYETLQRGAQEFAQRPLKGTITFNHPQFGRTISMSECFVPFRRDTTTTPGVNLDLPCFAIIW